MHYNGVLVSDNDLAPLSVPETSGISVYKGERDARNLFKKENMLFDSLKDILPQLDQSGPAVEHKLKEKGHRLRDGCCAKVVHVGLSCQLETYLRKKPGYPYFLYFKLPQVCPNEDVMDKGFPSALITWHYKSY